jgi:hypothetical protein
MIASPSVLDQEEALLLQIAALARRRAREVVEPDVADDIAQDVVLECLVKMRAGGWCNPLSLAGLIRQMVLRRTVDVYRRDRRRAERSAVHLSESTGTPPSWMQPDLALEEVEYTELRDNVLHVLPEVRDGPRGRADVRGRGDKARPLARHGVCARGQRASEATAATSRKRDLGASAERMASAARDCSAEGRGGDMITYTPRLLIAAANAHVGMSERSARAVGRVVARRLGTEASHNVPTLDVAMLLHWGHSSHYDIRAGHSSFPVLDTTTPDELAAFGARKHLLRVEPIDGDFFLLFSPKTCAFVRAGLVVQVRGRGILTPSASYFDVTTIEGDTNERGELGGGKVLRVERRLSPAAGDRFLRWADLGRPGEAPYIEGPSESIPRRRERVAL